MPFDFIRSNNNSRQQSAISPSGNNEYSSFYYPPRTVRGDPLLAQPLRFDRSLHRADHLGENERILGQT